MNGNDLISREALLKEYEWMMTQTSDCNKPILQEHIDRIKWQPAVDAVPVRHGKWKSMGDCGVTECSICKWSIEEYVGDYNYCPICGARMDEGGSGDDEAQD